MEFAGMLRISSEPTRAVHVVVEIAADQVAITGREGPIGKWSLADAHTHPISKGAFALKLGNDETVFSPDRAEDFQNQGLPVINQTVSKPLLDRLREKLASFDGPPGPEDVKPDSIVESPGADIAILPGSDQAASTNTSDTSMRCPATRADGQPCRSTILGTDGVCYAHSQNRPAPAPASYHRLLRRILTRLDRLMDDVESGEIEPRTLASVAQAVAGASAAVAGLASLSEAATTSAGTDAPIDEDRGPVNRVVEIRRIGTS